MHKSPSFFTILFGIGLLLALIMLVVIIRGWDSTEPEVKEEQVVDRVVHRTEVVSEQKPAGAIVEMDFKRDILALKEESLGMGYVLTQDVGERGSTGGQLITDNPMIYAETQYERIENTPLLIFTDDMIWQEGDGFVVKRDAIRDQARHIQEASIALSMAPRLRNGQVDGFQLVEIPPGTLFAKLGLKSGDAITRVNGGKPDIEPMALAFVNMLELRGLTEIEVERAGVYRTIKIKTSGE